jgi:phosphate transport system protein
MPKGVRELIDMSSKNYERDLAIIERDITTLFAMVTQAVSSAVNSLVENDVSAARIVMERDALIDSFYREIEEIAQRQFALHAPVALDMRYLLAVLRIVPALERAGDLAEHVASHAARQLLDGLPGRVILLISRMGSLAVSMWELLEAAYPRRDSEIGDRLRRIDNDIDELHVALMAEIIDAELPVPVAINVALVGRFIERLGDHAVMVGQKVRTLTIGVPGFREV